MSESTTARTFKATSDAGLDFDSFPMQLWAKAKKLAWDPQEIDFSVDAQQWRAFNEREREILLHLTALFLSGEEAVTLDLLPLIMTISKEGRLEEEMFLTSFLMEEAKHVEAFRRFFDAVDERSDLSRFRGPAYDRIFQQALPQHLDALKTDSSPVAQARASVTYNMIVEGVLAETGYHAYLEMLEANDLLPGMREVIFHLNRDESRHIAYGIYLLSRLVAENGDPLWESIEELMGELLPLALDIVSEMFARYDHELPFGLTEEAYTSYAMSQFQKRFMRLHKAREQNLDQLDQQANEMLQDEPEPDDDIAAE